MLDSVEFQVLPHKGRKAGQGFAPCRGTVNIFLLFKIAEHIYLYVCIPRNHGSYSLPKTLYTIFPHLVKDRTCRTKNKLVSLWTHQSIFFLDLSIWAHQHIFITILSSIVKSLCKRSPQMHKQAFNLGFQLTMKSLLV